MQGHNTQGWSRAQGEPAANIAGPKPCVPVYRDAAQLPLDDMEREHPLGDRLVRQDRPGRDITVVDVIARQGKPELFQVLCGQLPVRVRRGDRGQFVSGKDRVAGDCDRTHKDTRQG